MEWETAVIQVLIDRIVHPKVDWRRLLRNALRETTHEDYDWMLVMEAEPTRGKRPGQAGWYRSE
jgi:hypothetical protein